MGSTVFLIFDHSEEESVVVRANGLYALYRLHNGLRHHQFTPEECVAAFKRFIIEGMK